MTNPYWDQSFLIEHTYFSPNQIQFQQYYICKNNKKILYLKKTTNKISVFSTNRIMSENIGWNRIIIPCLIILDHLETVTLMHGRAWPNRSQNRTSAHSRLAVWPSHPAKNHKQQEQHSRWLAPSRMNTHTDTPSKPSPANRPTPRQAVDPADAARANVRACTCTRVRVRARVCVNDAPGKLQLHNACETQRSAATVRRWWRWWLMWCDEGDDDDSTAHAHRGVRVCVWVWVCAHRV